MSFLSKPSLLLLANDAFKVRPKILIKIHLIYRLDFFMQVQLNQNFGHITHDIIEKEHKKDEDNKDDSVIKTF